MPIKRTEEGSGGSSTTDPSSLLTTRGRSYVHVVGSLSTSAGKTLADSDFAPVLKPTRQANICLYGQEGSGKTTFCTRFAPEPVMVINFDGRSDDAVLEAREVYGRNVQQAKITLNHRFLPPDKMQIHAREILERAIYNYEIAIEESRRGNVRTILFDTATEFDRILKLAFDGTMEQTREGAFGVDKNFMNSQWSRIFDLARETKSAHVIVTARMSEIWKDGTDGQRKATGKFKPNCSKKVLESVDWAAQIKVKPPSFGESRARFEMHVTKAGTDIEQLFETYTEDQWEKLGPFVYSCIMNYRDSIPSDWK